MGVGILYLKHVQLINISTDAYIDVNEVPLLFDTTLIFFINCSLKLATKKQKKMLAMIPNFVKGRLILIN